LDDWPVGTARFEAYLSFEKRDFFAGMTRGAIFSRPIPQASTLDTSPVVKNKIKQGVDATVTVNIPYIDIPGCR